MSRDFNNFRFEGMSPSYEKHSINAKRISEDGNKILVDVAPEHLFKTRYGFALILDRTHVVFIKDWCVLNGSWGHTLVLLNRQYFNVKEWGEWGEFDEESELGDFDAWLEVAKQQADAKGMYATIKC